MEYKMGFEITKRRFNGGCSKVHCSHDKGIQWERNIRGSFRTWREAINMWDSDWDKRNEVFVQIERL